MYWFRNDGQGNFTPHLIQENHPQPRLERHAIGDFNGNGVHDTQDIDLLSDCIAEGCDDDIKFDLTGDRSADQQDQ